MLGGRRGSRVALGKCLLLIETSFDSDPYLEANAEAHLAHLGVCSDFGLQDILSQYPSVRTAHSGLKKSAIYMAIQCAIYMWIILAIAGVGWSRFRSPPRTLGKLLYKERSCSIYHLASEYYSSRSTNARRNHSVSTASMWVSLGSRSRRRIRRRRSSAPASCSQWHSGSAALMLFTGSFTAMNPSLSLRKGTRITRASGCASRRDAQPGLQALPTNELDRKRL